MSGRPRKCQLNTSFTGNFPIFALLLIFCCANHVNSQSKDDYHRKITVKMLTGLSKSEILSAYNINLTSSELLSSSFEGNEISVVGINCQLNNTPDNNENTYKPEFILFSNGKLKYIFSQIYKKPERDISNSESNPFVGDGFGIPFEDGMSFFLNRVNRNSIPINSDFDLGVCSGVIQFDAKKLFDNKSSNNPQANMDSSIGDKVASEPSFWSTLRPNASLPFIIPLYIILKDAQKHAPNVAEIERQRFQEVEKIQLSLKIGASLDGGGKAFASKHRDFLRWIPSNHDYGIIVISDPRMEGSRRGYMLFGIRSDHVEWIGGIDEILNFCWGHQFQKVSVKGVCDPDLGFVPF